MVIKENVVSNCTTCGHNKVCQYKEHVTEMQAQLEEVNKSEKLIRVTSVCIEWDPVKTNIR